MLFNAMRPFHTHPSIEIYMKRTIYTTSLISFSDGKNCAIYKQIDPELHEY